MDPFISIIVPVYNAEKTLERCVRSVLEQSFSNFELILINDGSADRSNILCDMFAAEEPRIQVIHQTNHGVSYARNVGMDLAGGEYITFLDSDDYLSPTHLEEYCSAIAASGCDVVIGGFTRMEQSAEAQQLPGKFGCFRNTIWNDICVEPNLYGYVVNKVFRAELLRKHQLHFNRRMYSQEDLDFCLSALGAAETIMQIPSVGYYYVYYPGKRIPPTWDFIANQLKLLRIAQDKTDLTPQARDCVRQRIVSLLYTGLYTASEQGTFTETVKRIAQVEGLDAFLASVPAEGEHRFVVKAFYAKNYRQIYLYFTVRNKIRDLYRTICNKNP